MAAASEVNAKISPVCKVYHPGDPVELEFSLRNLGRAEVEMTLAYPDHIGVYFVCDDGDALAPTELQRGGRIPSLRLKAGAEHKRLIALNRYLKLRKPKRYTIEFQADYMEPISDKTPRPRTFSSKGQFVVVVAPGRIDKERVRQYIVGLDGQDPLRAEESLEMLLWTEEPMVIDALIRGAERFPDFGHDVVRSLDKFFDVDRARWGILKVGRDGNANALREALRVYESRQRGIPTEFYEAVLSSGHTGKLYPTLEHLLKHGEAEHVPLVKPFEKHDNPEYRRLAKEFLEKMGE